MRAVDGSMSLERISDFTLHITKKRYTRIPITKVVYTKSIFMSMYSVQKNKKYCFCHSCTVKPLTEPVLDVMLVFYVGAISSVG